MAEKENTSAKVESFEEKHAALIASKINAGLTREGAIQCIKDQIANDAAKAAAAKPAKK